MIVDSSALVAVTLNEEDAWDLERKLTQAETLRISAGSLLEVSIVLESKRRPEVVRVFERLLSQLEIQVEPVTAAHVAIGKQAYREYGKGSGHKANLNFGDCFAYALASETGEPLLCKGDDFRHTDLELA